MAGLGHRQDRGVMLPPLDEIDGFMVRPGFYNSEGAVPTARGVSFTIHSVGATGCTLLLFRPQEKEPYARLKYPEAYHIGNTFAMLVFGLKIDEFEYAFQLDGPYDESRGLLFDKNNVLLDPFAKAVTGQRNWGERPESDEGFVYHARVVENNFDWGKMTFPEIPAEDLIIYETHVRGFTRDASSGVTAGGTFEGLRQKIPYLKDLGVNAIELLPIFEFDEMESARVVDGVQLYNYWGYNTVSFFAPNTSYSSVVEHNHEGDELKLLISELKANGMEVILDVVFNHTAEGNENGPCFSFKGIDNNIYYMLTPDGHYYNFSGCGNAMNCNHPIMRKFIIDCLRYWVMEYRVDGFRFDLASILTRDQNGAPMPDPPILQGIACDPILGHVKLIAEAWDAAGLYQVGSFPAFRRWSEWNGRYRDDMRRFLKGDGSMAGTAINRIIGSTDLYDPVHRGESASVNFLTCHDGFTLYDLYSYNTKHNEKNGWNNTDGDNNGNSWNCGVEQACPATHDPPEIRENLKHLLDLGKCRRLLRGRILRLQRRHQFLHPRPRQGARSEQHPGQRDRLRRDRHRDECLLFRGRTRPARRGNPRRALRRAGGSGIACRADNHRKRLPDRTDHHPRRRLPLGAATQAAGIRHGFLPASPAYSATSTIAVRGGTFNVFL